MVFSGFIEFHRINIIFPAYGRIQIFKSCLRGLKQTRKRKEKLCSLKDLKAEKPCLPASLFGKQDSSIYSECIFKKTMDPF